MKSKISYKKRIGLYLALSVGILGLGTVYGYAAKTHFGIDLSNSKEPVELYANSLEVQDKEGIAIFCGNVSLTQGENLLRTSKLVVYYDKEYEEIDGNQVSAKSVLPMGFGSTAIKRMEASGKVYIKTATQIATGDEGVFDGKSNIVVLTGRNVMLIDGDNIAKGCKLTVNMKTGKASLEGCKEFDKRSRASMIFKLNQKNDH
ncbi:LptA/OstA family protein [Bartonella sp. F02]|uniref:LptA/OstA family protein n=1 Tax=Bartonella sp. F02 TaxID=2967262 RepID=UPI0022A92C2F|nr:LptA/OstA family protein [Bartonella sp. F02]MCZ2327944.1 LPS ABC transporter substrate-binding protein LptA [Bartonella sp. F02]